MKPQLLAAAAALLAAQAHATVIFNWVQTGTPSATNQTLPFSLGVADAVYTAAQSSPVTFGAYTMRLGVEQTSASYLQAQTLSADVSAAVRVNNEITGDSQVVTLAQGLGQCNSPPWYSLVCRVGFSSTSVQTNTVFSDFFRWGAGVYFYDGTQTSSFTLSGNALASSYTTLRSFGDGATISTNSQGAGTFALLTEGLPSALHGTGYWAVDPSTIPVPLPPSAWLMALGLPAVLLRTRRRAD